MGRRTTKALVGVVDDLLRESTTDIIEGNDQHNALAMVVAYAGWNWVVDHLAERLGVTQQYLDKRLKKHVPALWKAHHPEARRFKPGDRVLWLDIDNGACSGSGTVTRFRPDVVSVRKDDQGEVECLPGELRLIQEIT